MTPSSAYLEVVKREMRLPTRLEGSYAAYEAAPDWHAQMMVGDIAATRKRLATMPGRADSRWEEGDYARYDEARQVYHGLDTYGRKGVKRFRRQKALYFSAWASQYGPVMNLFKEGGILGVKKHDEKGDKTWRVVAEHSLVAAKIAEVLAKAMEKELAACGQTVQEIVIGTLLQDIIKREEIEFNRGEDMEAKRARIIALVAQEYGDSQHLVRIQAHPEDANVVHEILLQNRAEARYRQAFGDGRHGNLSTIMACYKSSGMPVVTRYNPGPDGHYLPTLGERIANMADKMVQHTAIIQSLRQRHHSVRLRYFPPERVDQEYVYAHQCATEFAALIPGVASGDDLPAWVQEKIMEEILAIPLTPAVSPGAVNETTLGDTRGA